MGLCTHTCVDGLPTPFAAPNCSARVQTATTFRFAISLAFRDRQVSRPSAFAIFSDSFGSERSDRTVVTSCPLPDKFTAYTLPLK